MSQETRQRRFAKEFAKTLDPYKAAETAGYAPETIAGTLSKNERMQAQVSEAFDAFCGLYDAIPVSALRIPLLRIMTDSEATAASKVSAAKLLIGTDWGKAFGEADSLGDMMRSLSEIDEDEDPE